MAARQRQLFMIAGDMAHYIRKLGLLKVSKRSERRQTCPSASEVTTIWPMALYKLDYY